MTKSNHEKFRQHAVAVRRGSQIAAPAEYGDPPAADLAARQVAFIARRGVRPEIAGVVATLAFAGGAT